MPAITLATSLARGTDPGTGLTTPNVISGVGATRTLTQGETGSLCLFDVATGVVFTLPPAAAGLTFTFLVSIAVSSNAHKFITNSATEFLVGGCGSFSSAVAEGGDAFAADGTTHRSVSSNGTTTGGQPGQMFTVTAISATQWAVTGNTIGSGILATPFATS
jgi:hypothetical protein